MTISRYNKKYYTKTFIVSIGVFVAMLTYGIFTIVQASNKYSLGALNEKIEASIASNERILAEIKKIEATQNKKLQATIDIQNEKRAINTYLNRLNTIGINEGLFEVRLAEIRPNPNYVNHANVELEIRTPTKYLSNDLSAEIFADTILKDTVLKSAFGPFKNHFEVLGNRIYYTTEKKAVKDE